MCLTTALSLSTFVLFRRVMAGLREHGYVRSEKGHGGGWTLACDLSRVTLRDIYNALGSPSLLAIGNRTEAPGCLVEEAVNAALDRSFRDAKARLLARLGEVTLAALSNEVRRRLATCNGNRSKDVRRRLAERGVRDLLAKSGLQTQQIDACLAVSRIEASSAEQLRKEVGALGVEHELLATGLEELCTVLDRCALLGGQVVGALHIARGFDYYTGTVVEGVLRDHPNLGSICSGGRYDNLASTKKPLPGVGVSIGITRLMSFLQHLDLLQPRRKTPVQVFLLLHSEQERPLSLEVASSPRQRGVACVLSDSARAYGKQMQQAERLGIDYVWFPAHGGEPHSVKDLASGSQQPVDLSSWTPDPSRLALDSAIVSPE